MEKALLKQVGCDLRQLYPRGFRNKYTKTITTNIAPVLEHLFTTYGAVEAEKLIEKEDILKQKVFNVVDVLIIIYNEVKEFQHLVIVSGNLFSIIQQIVIVIQLSKNLNDGKTGLISWFDLPTENTTWP